MNQFLVNLTTYWLSLRTGFDNTMDHVERASDILVRDRRPTIADPEWKGQYLPDFLRHTVIQPPVLWFVHGYNAETDCAAKAYDFMRDKVCEYMAFADAPAFCPRTIFYVLWAGGWSGLLSFLPAWYRAATAGKLLRAAFSTMALRMPRGRHRFVGHSMGVRVLAEAFKSSRWMQDPMSFVFANGAIDADALNHTGEYGRLPYYFDIRNFHSHRDPVLGIYPIGRAPIRKPWRWNVPAIGRKPYADLAPKDPLSRMVRHYDFSNDPEHATDHGGARKTEAFYRVLLDA